MPLMGSGTSRQQRRAGVIAGLGLAGVALAIALDAAPASAPQPAPSAQDTASPAAPLAASAPPGAPTPTAAVPTRAPAPAPPGVIAASSEPGAADDSITDMLSSLPPEDVEWVLDEVARHQQVRAVDDQALVQLVSQLASVRQHAVLERTEPMMPRDHGGAP